LAPYLKPLYVVLFVLLLWQPARAHNTPKQGTVRKVTFVENAGQWDNNAAFRATIPGGSVYAEKQALHYIFRSSKDLATAMKHPRPFEDNFIPHTINGHAVRVVFAGASEDVRIHGEQVSSEYFNYFIGNDPKYWKTHVRSFQQLQYQNLYQNIDATLYATDDGQLKYDLIVLPGGKPSSIQLRYEGQESITLKNGNLRIRTSVNDWIEQKPYAYQLVNGVKHTVTCRYKLEGTTVHFELGTYDSNLPLVIDPKLIFSTYSGSSVDNFGHSATYDNSGNLYAAGIATSPTDFANGRYPVTPGAFQQVWGGGVGAWPQQGFPCDMAISKYTPDGSALIFATYLGGSNNDYPHSLVSDEYNNLVVFGTTLSRNYPTKTGSYDVSFNDSFDIVVTKFSADGTRLIGSTYIGGNKADGINTSDSLRMNYADEFRGEVLIDKNNDIVVATSTQSANFPVTAGAYQTSLSGKQDGCLFRLDSNLTTLKASTYFGQSNHDAIYSLDIDSTGNIFFSGGTQSTTFAVNPNTHLGNYHGGFCDGFLGKIDSNLSSLRAFRYWGGTSYDQSYFVKLDPEENPVIFGQHFDSIPIINAGFYRSSSSLFLTKFKPSLDSILFSTSFGNGTPNNALSPSAFMVDECGVMYGSVWSGNTNRFGNYINRHPSQVVTSTSGLTATPDAIQTSTDGEDFYLWVIEKQASALLYGTYFGEAGSSDHVDGGTSRFDSKGIIYQSVCASCSEGTSGAFFTTPGSYSPTNKSPRCSNASFKLDFRKSNVVYAQFDYAPKKLCLDSYLVVTHTNLSYNGLYHFWYVNGVLKDTSLNFIDTIRTAGTYIVKLIEVDSSRCIIIDSAFTSYTVGFDALASFTTQRDSCSAFYTFTNTTIPSSAPIIWYFGSGDTSTAHLVHRTFPSNGLYQVLLMANPGSGCVDSAVQSLYFDSIAHLVRASFSPPDSNGCEPKGLTFFNTSNKFVNLRWQLNDTLVGTAFTFDTILNKGLYTLKLVAIDSATCNKSDSTTMPIKVVPYIYPEFTYKQDSCSFAVSFTNTSLILPGDTINYFWDFGNGITSNLAEPTIVFDTAGQYIVTLKANPSLACEEETGKVVIVSELPGILNAYFTAQPQESCTPAIVKFLNQSSNQQSQQWYYNGVLRSSLVEFTDTFFTDTTLQVLLVIKSAITCIPADSFETTVTVHNATSARFGLVRDTCSAQVFFFNQSTSDNGEPLAFKWYFGDGDSSQAINPTHVYANDSSYVVTLITNAGSFCADTIQQTINYIQDEHLLDADYVWTVNQLCSPTIINAAQTSLNGKTIEWRLNGVLVSTDSIYTDTLLQPGMYTLLLTAYNPAACTKADTFSNTFAVGLSGIADFILSRDSCSLEVAFKNQSVSPTGLPIPYTWYFGDGDSSTETNPVHTYAATNTYTIMLITNAGSACADTATQIWFIDGDSLQEIMIPNVFTPNSDGLNDCYRVKGISARCDEYHVTIYNRWGEIYFETTDPQQCWNGQNEKGVNASDGVYYYIMDIKKKDQERKSLRGTITLIRD
jgi:gliding motility-associated-like protein